MAYMITFEHPGEVRLPHLPVAPSAGERGARAAFEERLSAGETGLGFRVLDAEGRELAKGGFMGGDKDRDVPLEMVRNCVQPHGIDVIVRLEYEDGRAWCYAPEFDLVIEDES